jgi:hypothetical protein
MTKIYTLSSLLIVGTCLWGQTAWAAVSGPCASFSVSPDDSSVVYDPFSPGEQRNSFTVQAQRSSDEVASIRATLRDPTPNGGSPQMGPAGLRDYDISNANQRQNSNSFSQNPGSSFSIGSLDFTFNDAARGNSGRASQRLELTIPALQSTGAGVFRQSLEVEYTCFNAAREEISRGVQTGSGIEFQVEIKRTFSVSTGSQGSTRGSIAFGPINVSSTGPLSGRAVISVRSSIDYRVSMKGNDDFRLRGPRNASMPYSATIAGRNLTKNFSMLCSATNSSGSDLSVDVILDTSEASQLPAGNYNDTLILTFEPNDGGRGSSSSC